MPEGQGPGLHHLSAPRIWPSLGTECSVFEGGPEAEMGERPYGGTGQGQGPKCGCVYSWMVTCHLTAVWRTTCCCCPPSDPRMQAPTSALPLTARARSKPLPICRCQVRQHPPRDWQCPAHCLVCIVSNCALCWQSGWYPTSHRPRTPSCRCPPSRMPTGSLRSRSPSGLTQLMVSRREAELWGLG